MQRKKKIVPRKGDFKRGVRKRSTRYILSADTKIEYKNLAVLQKFFTDRGKIVSRRISGISGQRQRKLSIAVKRARYLGLLSAGGAKRR